MNPDAEQNVARGLHQFSIWAWRSWMQRYAKATPRSTRLRRASLPSRPICSSSTQGPMLPSSRPRCAPRWPPRSRPCSSTTSSSSVSRTCARAGHSRGCDRRHGRCTSVDWNNILDQVRARYSMVEERVLFDFMMRGLRAEQMLKALQSLREAAAPGSSNCSKRRGPRAWRRCPPGRDRLAVRDAGHYRT